MALLLIVVITWSLYHLLRSYVGLLRLPRKINIKDINIELFEQKQDFSFDKYLNEVLYLFEHCGADAVVFEDLDRYETTQIFGKIREISDIMWQRFPMRKEAQLIEYKKEMLVAPPKFLYLLKDDVFTCSDRNKFFDYIIPVIPVADASNSADKLKSALKKAGLDSEISERFLKDISLYLGDMRLLTNIVNEYQIYRLQLDSSGIKRSSDMQLAMIIYKNLFPRDFMLLQQGRGYVYHLLDMKPSLIQEQESQINDDIEQIRSQIEDSNEEILADIDEVNALFFPEPGEIIYIDDVRVPDGTPRKNAIAHLLQATTGRLFRGGTLLTFNVSDLIARMEQNQEYIRRKEAVLNKGKTRKQQLERKISLLEAERAHLISLPLRELIINSAEFDWKCELPAYEVEKDNEYLAKIADSEYFGLLKYLVINGYISEEYPVYTSFFYPDMLSASDKRFLLALKAGESLSCDYHLEQPGKVLASINVTDFMLNSIDNYDLFAQILRANDAKQIACWFDAAKKRAEFSTHPIDFIIEFWKKGRETVSLIHSLNRHNPEWFQTWILEGFFESPVAERHAILDVLYCCNSTELERFNLGDGLTSKIAYDESFLQIDNPDIPAIIRSLKNLNVKFERITARQKDSELVRQVYESNLYELNAGMIHRWMSEYLGYTDNQIERRSYTLLSQHPSEPLTQYIEQEPEKYLAAILHSSEARFADDEDYVLNLINSKDINSELIYEYFLRSDTMISQIESITDTLLWDYAIQQNTVKCTGENIARYFVLHQDTDNTLRTELVNFINNSKGKFEWTYASISSWVGDSGRDGLLSALIRCNSLNSERYRACLKPLGLRYRSFTLSSLSDEHIDILIEIGIIPITVETLTFMRDNYPNHIIDYIAGSQFNKYTDLARSGEIDVTSQEIEELLCLSTIAEDDKLHLLSLYDSVLIPRLDYSPAINVAIIQNHLDTSETPSLIQEYDQHDESVQNAIIHYAESDLSFFLQHIKNNGEISEKLYAALLPILDESSAKAIRQYIKNKDFDAVCTSSIRPTFKGTAENESILYYFRAHSWISSYSKNFDGSLRAYPKKSAHSAIPASGGKPKRLI